MIDEALRLVERIKELRCLPKPLRVKRELPLLQNELNAAAGEDHFLQSLDWACRQGALSWELRTVMSLA